MIVFTTLFPAMIIILAGYFVAVRQIPWAILNYTIMIGIGIACLFPGEVHFRYTGIEVAGLGALLVYTHHHFIKPKKETARGYP